MSYQSENIPKYDAKEIARYIAKTYGSLLILGSATPIISTYYRTESGIIGMNRLTKRVKDITMPEVKIIDLSKEKDIISEELKSLIQDRIDKKEQTILFLNRRGYSALSVCTNCRRYYKM